MRKSLLFGVIALFFSNFLNAQVRIESKFFFRYTVEALFGDKQYTVFIVKFKNEGKKSLRIGDNYLLLTDTGKKYRPRPALWMRKDIRDREKVKDKFIWIGPIPPGKEKERIVVFNPVDKKAKEITLLIYGIYENYRYELKYKKIGKVWKCEGGKFTKIPPKRWKTLR